MHHYFSERDGNGRSGAPPPGAPVRRCEELHNSRRVPGRRNAGTGVAGRGEIAEPVWAGFAGTSGGRGDGSVFGARGKKRITEVADGLAGAAEAGLPDARRASRRPSSATGHYAKFSLEGVGGKISGHCGNWVNGIPKNGCFVR